MEFNHIAPSRIRQSVINYTAIKYSVFFLCIQRRCISKVIRDFICDDISVSNTCRTSNMIRFIGTSTSRYQKCEE